MKLKRSWIQTKVHSGKNWLKIFSHEMIENNYFTSEKELQLTNNDGKFSIIGAIDESFKVNGVYEFLLEYPDISDNYNQWNQTVFPLDSIKYNPDIEYKKIQVFWDVNFFGLSRSNEPKSYIDGAIDGNWYYAIGAKKSHDVENQFPGPCYQIDSSTGFCINGTSVSKVNLWIYSPLHSIANLMMNPCKNAYHKTKIDMSFITIYFLLSNK